MTIDPVNTSADDAQQAESSGDGLRERVIAALQTVHDPEIPVNIYELGLIYRLEIDAEGRVGVDMTLTTPNCPVADMIPEQVMEAVQGVDGVTAAHVELVWDPPWDPSKMSDEAQMALGMF